MAVVLDEARERATRRLAAILVAGYSRLLPGDEKENFAELRALLKPSAMLLTPWRIPRAVTMD